MSEEKKAQVRTKNKHQQAKCRMKWKKGEQAKNTAIQRKNRGIKKAKKKIDLQAQSSPSAYRSRQAEGKAVQKIMREGMSLEKYTQRRWEHFFFWALGQLLQHQGISMKQSEL